MPIEKGQMVHYKIDVTLSYFIKRGSGGTEYRSRPQFKLTCYNADMQDWGFIMEILNSCAELSASNKSALGRRGDLMGCLINFLFLLPKLFLFFLHICFEDGSCVVCFSFVSCPSD